MVKPRRPERTRREFLRGAAILGASLVAGRGVASAAREAPAASSRPAAASSRVVHAHSDQATFWDYATGWYGDYVSQAVVDAMTDQGVMALTNTATPAAAWQSLIPGYVSGQKVAIKVNFNNASCSSAGQVIDALPQPANSVIRGLKSAGVSESDIRIYDVTHAWHDGRMPATFVGKVVPLFPGVQFHAYDSSCATSLGYSASAKIHFDFPLGKPPIGDLPICNALATATYLINMPIMKKHGMAGVTLGFKNHFGSFEHCDLVHWSVDLGDPSYVSSYSGLVDIYANSHIWDKTILTVGDALYAARISNYGEVPSPWPTFGFKSPNSLFFSRDPVAIDCVMYDLLTAEGGVRAGSDDHLVLAAARGLGTFEHWDVSHHYHTIDYQRLEISLPLPYRMYLPDVRGS